MGKKWIAWVLSVLVFGWLAFPHALGAASKEQMKDKAKKVMKAKMKGQMKQKAKKVMKKMKQKKQGMKLKAKREA